MPEIDIGPDSHISALWSVVRGATRAARAVVAALPDDPDTLLARGLIATWAGRPDDARAALQAARDRGDARACSG
ncbi:MAG: hypothetical protein R3F59_02940 [Myxococcota bacterium]